MTAYDDFLTQPTVVARHGQYLAHLDLVDGAGADASLYFSQRGYSTTAADTPASKPHARRIPPDWSPETQYSLWNGGRIGGPSLPSASALLIANHDGALDGLTPRNGYVWAGRTCTIRHGSGTGSRLRPEFMDYADFGTQTFRTGEPKLGNVIEVPLLGPEHLFSHPLQERVYSGTDGCLHFAANAYGAPASKVTALDITGDLTIEGWFYVDNLSNNRFICTWNAGAGVTTFPFELRLQATSGVLRFTASNITALTTTAAVTTGSRWHLSISVDGTAVTWILYDWLTDTETVETATASAGTRDAADGEFEVSRNSAGQSWVGMMDEVRIWNTARTRAEIRQYRNQPLTTVPAECVARWAMDDETGTTAADDSASGADLTLTGTVAWYPSLQGRADLAGTVVPDAWGQVEHAPPVLVAPAVQGGIYQWAAVGEVQSTTPYDGANELTLDTAYTDFYTFLDATTPSSTYDTYNKLGLVRLGSNPSNPITVSGEGYIGSGYSSVASDLIQQIVESRTRAPLATGEIDTGSLSALEAKNSNPCGFWTQSAVPVADVLTLIATGIGAWWGYPRGGSLFEVGRVEGPAGTADHDLDNLQHAVDAQRLDDQGRVGAVRLSYRRVYRVLSDGEISTAGATADEQQLVRQEWREAFVSDYDLLADYPDAPTLELETALQTREAAFAEAARLLALYNGTYEAFRVTVGPRGRSIAAGETVTVTLYTQRGSTSTRYGMDGTRRFLVVAVRDVGDDGTSELTVWG